MFFKKRKEKARNKENAASEGARLFPVLYDEEEINALETYIQKEFGAFESVFHEVVSPDIHVDIAVIPPNGKRNYYTLVTMGMGARRMNVPSELKQYQLERAEIVACLPADWELKNDDEKWYWPLRWMKILARLPIEQDTWLGFGHTAQSGGPFAENTKLCCALLLEALCKKDGRYAVLPNGEIVRFYQMFPIYEEEMKLKLSSDTETLLEGFRPGELSPVINITRRNVCG